MRPALLALLAFPCALGSVDKDTNDALSAFNLHHKYRDAVMHSIKQLETKNMHTPGTAVSAQGLLLGIAYRLSTAVQVIRAKLDEYIQVATTLMAKHGASPTAIVAGTDSLRPVDVLLTMTDQIRQEALADAMFTAIRTKEDCNGWNPLGRLLVYLTAFSRDDIVSSLATLPCDSELSTETLYRVCSTLQDNSNIVSTLAPLASLDALLKVYESPLPKLDAAYQLRQEIDRRKLQPDTNATSIETAKQKRKTNLAAAKSIGVYPGTRLVNMISILAKKSIMIREVGQLIKDTAQLMDSHDFVYDIGAGLKNQDYVLFLAEEWPLEIGRLVLDAIERPAELTNRLCIFPELNHVTPLTKVDVDGRTDTLASHFLVPGEFSEVDPRLYSDAWAVLATLNAKHTFKDNCPHTQPVLLAAFLRGVLDAKTLDEADMAANENLARNFGARFAELAVPANVPHDVTAVVNYLFGVDGPCDDIHVPPVIKDKFAKGAFATKGPDPPAPPDPPGPTSGGGEPDTSQSTRLYVFLAAGIVFLLVLVALAIGLYRWFNK